MNNPSASDAPKFTNGDSVRRISRTADIGVIIGEPRRINNQYSYRVNFGGRIQNFGEEDLELCRSTDDPRELFLQGSFGDAESCQMFLTWLRVSGGLSNYVYSFYNSRTKFYPHQFKPLVKFLDSAHGRILLADEVGLGKTIETGFVFLEMIARNELNRALIVCPAKLRNKWRREMIERFDLNFDILNSKQLVGQLNELTQRIRTDFNAIVSYETVRSERVTDALSESTLELDVLVADEAHNVRNSDSNTFRAATILADRSTKVLFLTATPINNRSEDLFNLLRLLDPERFSDYQFFETQRQVNRNVVEIEGLIRQGNESTLKRIGELIQTLEASPLGTVFTGQYFFEKAKKTVAAHVIGASVDWVELQRCVSKFNLLSTHIVRTKRVDVEEKRPKRSPHCIRMIPDAIEKTLYKETFDVLMRHYDAFRLPVMNVERILSSCLPAFVEHYQAICKGLEDVASWDDDDDDNSTTDEPVAKDKFTSSLAVALKPILDTHGLKLLHSGVDSKYNALLDVLKELDANDEPGCKIIVFSYFRRTIEYLSRRLANAGYKNVFIHGGVPSNPDNPAEDERELRTGRFKNDSSIRILLSSEVGSEGLDFQFSHVVVNYDLPWNPMRVEQRIGRVDRINQKSERIMVYSLLLQDTVDDIIYDKLLNKIDVFKESLGDMEGILGAELEKVRDAVFNSKLSPAERAEQLALAADVLKKQMDAVRELEKDTAKILGADQYIKDEIERIRSSHRYVGPAETLRLVHREFESAPLNMNIDDESKPVYAARIGSTTRQYFDRYMDRSRAANLFRTALDEKSLLWTFDYEIAMTRPDVELLNLRHPGVRAICAKLEENASHLSPTFKVKCKIGDKDSVLKPGTFILAIYNIEYNGAFPRKELVTVGWDVDSSQCISETVAGAFLGRLLEEVEDLPNVPIGLEALTTGVATLESRACLLFEEKRSELEGEDNALLEERRQQIHARATRDIASQEERKRTIEEKLHWIEGGNDKRTIQSLRNLLRSVEINKERVQERTELKLSQLPKTVKVTTSWALRSLGVVQLVNTPLEAAQKPLRADVKAIMDDAEKRLAELIGKGWTKDDFARELKTLLGLAEETENE